jgi:hypothetical protein
MILNQNVMEIPYWQMKTLFCKPNTQFCSISAAVFESLQRNFTLKTKTIKRPTFLKIQFSGEAEMTTDFSAKDFLAP